MGEFNIVSFAAASSENGNGIKIMCSKQDMMS